MSFFKVIGPSFHRRLELPPDVCKQLKNAKSCSVKLKSRLGTWKVGLFSNGDAVFLYEGWSEFVDRHDLSQGEFLVFEQTCHPQLHFNVSVFDSSWDEKEFAVAPEENREDAVEEQEEEEEEESPSFSKIMVSNYATKKITVNIPINFMKANDLGHQRSAILRDPRRREWTVDLTTWSNKVAVRSRMWRGWHDFYASNSLKNGDTCVFRLRRRLVTQTNIFFDVEILPA